MMNRQGPPKNRRENRDHCRGQGSRVERSWAEAGEGAIKSRRQKAGGRSPQEKRTTIITLKEKINTTTGGEGGGKYRDFQDTGGPDRRRTRAASKRGKVIESHPASASLILLNRAAKSIGKRIAPGFGGNKGRGSMGWGFLKRF